MKMNFKKTLSLILAVLMVMTAVPLSGMATGTEPCDHSNGTYSNNPALKKHYFWCECGYSTDWELCTGGTATCVAAAVCTVCELPYGKKLDHSFTATDIADKFYVEGTGDCQNKKEYYYNCANDGCDEIDTTRTFDGAYGEHKPDAGVSNEDAACGVDGTLTITCTVCGDVLSDDTVDEGSALEHVFDKEVESDDRKVEDSEATCMAGAEYYLTCSRPGCDEWSETATFTGTPDEDAHNFLEFKDEDFLKSEATCSKNAVYYKWCSVCARPANMIPGCEDETFEAPNTRHAKPTSTRDICEVFYKKTDDGKNFAEDDKGNLIVLRDREVIYEANCMEPEKCSYLCAKCGEPLVPADEYVPGNTYSAEYELYINYQHPALNPNHELEETTIDGKKVKLMELVKDAKYWDSTCTEEGKTKTYKCLFHDGPNNIVGGEAIPVKGHTYKTEVSKAYRAADCRQAGHQASQSCTVCKTTYYWDKDGKLLDKTNTFDPNKSPVDITFDKLDHKDTNGDGLCDLKYIKADGKEDICGLDINADVIDCSCICHSGGFMFIVALILKWFWKLTGAKQYCACGDAHY